MYQHVSVQGTLRAKDLATDDAGMCLGAGGRVVRSDVNGECLGGIELLLADWTHKLLPILILYR